jgi:2-oxoglutarate ferredoxin oxidoreductase subunit delta
MPCVKIDSELCKGCKLCMKACVKKILLPGETNNSKGYRYMTQIDGDKCTGCTLCAIMCPDSAIEVYK